MPLLSSSLMLPAIVFTPLTDLLFSIPRPTQYLVVCTSNTFARFAQVLVCASRCERSDFNRAGS